MLDIYPSPMDAVSIHALLAECDPNSRPRSTRTRGFNPRTPCGVRLPARSPIQRRAICFNPRTPCGVRQGVRLAVILGKGFQSTHSLRSATCWKTRKRTPKMFQSTHSLRSATRLAPLKSAPYRVSIHALLAECDPSPGKYHQQGMVSIHALLAECDIETLTRKETKSCFNPRTPCGVRPRLRRRQGCPCGFNPRTPCGVRQRN